MIKLYLLHILKIYLSALHTFRMAYDRLMILKIQQNLLIDNMIARLKQAGDDMLLKIRQ